MNVFGVYGGTINCQRLISKTIGSGSRAASDSESANSTIVDVL